MLHLYNRELSSHRLINFLLSSFLISERSPSTPNETTHIELSIDDLGEQLSESEAGKSQYSQGSPAVEPSRSSRGKQTFQRAERGRSKGGEQADLPPIQI